jgi:hypothetical protein
VNQTMPEIRISITLPYALRLTEGEYQTSQVGEIIRISAPLLEATTPQTIVSATFFHDEITDPSEKQQIRTEDAKRLLRRTNRMLRWYRAVRQRADITELTRAQASPFRFELVSPGDSAGWIKPIQYEKEGPIPLPLTVEEVTDQVRNGLAGGRDPMSMSCSFSMQIGRWNKDDFAKPCCSAGVPSTACSTASSIRWST